MARPLVRYNRPRVTYSRLRELLHYDCSTGIWTWKALSHARSNIPVGSIAGSISSNGSNAGPVESNVHRVISIDNIPYQAARLAVLYVRRRWPRPGCVVDCIDRNPLNLAWSNLREAGPQGDSANSARNHKRVGLLKGSYLVNGKYRAAIHIKGKTKHLGTFATSEEAHSVYLRAAKEQFGAFACDGKPPKGISDLSSETGTENTQASDANPGARPSRTVGPDAPSSGHSTRAFNS